MKKTSLLIAVLVILLSCNKEQRGNLSNIFMNKRSFDDLVTRFESEARTKSQKPEKVIDLLGDISGKKIMDIGSGTGYFSFRLANRGADIIAADVDDRFIAYAKEQIAKRNTSKVQTRKVEYHDPLLSENEVDHVLIVNTYHHIDDRVEYFSKVAKGINNGGSLMVVDFKKNKKSEGPPKRYRVSSDKVTEELKKSGFSKFEVNHELLENQYIVIAHK